MMVATRGVMDNIPSELQMAMWEIYFGTDEKERDFLQCYRLDFLGNHTLITMSQEVPEIKARIFSHPYKKELEEKKVWIIDDGNHLTMLLPQEY